MAVADDAPSPPMPPREWLDKHSAPSKGAAGNGWQVGWQAGYLAGLQAARGAEPSGRAQVLSPAPVAPMTSEIDVKHCAAIAAGRYDHTGPAYFLPAVRDVLEALSAAGRLLPDGGETRIEWGPRCSDPSHLGHLFVHGEMVSRNAVDGYRARREVREWPDGSSWTGPWVEVTDA